MGTVGHVVGGRPDEDSALLGGERLQRGGSVDDAIGDVAVAYGGDGLVEAHLDDLPGPPGGVGAIAAVCAATAESTGPTRASTNDWLCSRRVCGQPNPVSVSFVTRSDMRAAGYACAGTAEAQCVRALLAALAGDARRATLAL
ncbi:hypothetical protein SAMN05421833_12932 [Microbispora rosea]|uniref:Uncharacterized protein n=1 Tax=Microbispora rosea TaxID=58117 RepID=A0A1N7GHT4_9ACTN|nr:hypothetical protein [Microbispora rosea]GIH51618.1 hypothetical protein Mro03_67970 [Microbispora rosea subsp. rosea]SIS12147.1 hypothetical protein SAMN05421833_12932 [Microbispora rosea]